MHHAPAFNILSNLDKKLSAGEIVVSRHQNNSCRIIKIFLSTNLSPRLLLVLGTFSLANDFKLNQSRFVSLENQNLPVKLNSTTLRFY